MYTVHDIQKRYGVRVHTVLQWIRAGELRAVNVARKVGARRPRWRVSQEAVEAFEQLRSSTPPPPRARRRKEGPADIIKFY
jgi:transposase